MAHDSFKTLVDSLERSEGKRFSPSELARALNVSEQVVTNWAKRGISVEGALAAQFVFQKDANFILGRLPHPMMVRMPQPGELPARNPDVVYLPVPENPVRDEVLDLFGQLETESQREWMADLRGFVRGRRPHPVGSAPAVAAKK